MASAGERSVRARRCSSTGVVRCTRSAWRPRSPSRSWTRHGRSSGWTGCRQDTWHTHVMRVTCSSATSGRTFGSETRSGHVPAPLPERAPTPPRYTLAAAPLLAVEQLGKPPSSSGLGHRPFKAAARVRIPLGARSTNFIHAGVEESGVLIALSRRRSRDRSPSPAPDPPGQVAQMAEHAAENRGVGSSILPLATDRSRPRLAHHLDVERAGAERAVEPKPERQVHLGPPAGADVS